MKIITKTTLAAVLLAGSTLSPLPLLAQDAANQKLVPPGQTQQDNQVKGSASVDGSAQMKPQSGSADAGAKSDARIKPQSGSPEAAAKADVQAKPQSDQAQFDQMNKPGSANKSGDTAAAGQADPKLKANSDSASSGKPSTDNKDSTAATSQPESKDSQTAQGKNETGATDARKADTAQGAVTETNERKPNSASADRPSNEITGSINISTEQRTEIRNVIVENKVETVKPTFSVSVGVAVPKTVKLHRLPPKVVEIVPQYRTYEYFVLADNRIVIVEPSTYEIVYILVV
ncbi:DUF1236 domain-containing protein [Rhizobium sp. XQZ8]|nr:DUF1236 domain-containing protein [Rhizobium populisoli]